MNKIQCQQCQDTGELESGDSCQECCDHGEFDHGICGYCELDCYEDLAGAAYASYKGAQDGY